MVVVDFRLVEAAVVRRARKKGEEGGVLAAHAAQCRAGRKVLPLYDTAQGILNHDSEPLSWGVSGTDYSTCYTEAA